MKTLHALAAVLIAYSLVARACADSPESLQVATFKVDATPPLGSPLCEGAVPPAKSITDPLSARGIVLTGAGKPIVLCAVDWVGIANASHDAWRAALAEAAGTEPARVCVHTLHQHDAPGCDMSCEELLASRGLRGHTSDGDFSKRAIAAAAGALREAMGQLQPVTHVGVGSARVEGVASNRRLLGPDGRVQHVRFSSCKDPAVRALPEGVIDPLVRVVSFWNGDKPVAVLSYYATHPQSFYGEGDVSADFVGMARDEREAALPGVPHIHFCGAGGNVAAGKYNDGTPPVRPELAGRLADGMRRAWVATARVPLSPADVEWRTAEVALPLRDIATDAPAMFRVLDDPQAPVGARVNAARNLAYTLRVQGGGRQTLACLRLGDVYVLHMPGELFVEYQLAAARMKPHSTVCMAAYGDYGPGYIGTEISYGQGGYETSPVSRTAPEVEKALMDGMAELLK